MDELCPWAKGSGDNHPSELRSGGAAAVARRAAAGLVLTASRRAPPRGSCGGGIASSSRGSCGASLGELRPGERRRPSELGEEERSREEGREMWRG
jgi:hypothetical protein